ncbi:MAG: hypothetical protein ISR77_03355 [Pirellulaceae bacterium]|nr:hypothetical protein [Pirellulaceae bacterium]
MRQYIRPILFVFAAAGLLAVIPISVYAQSGSRSYPPSGSSRRASSSGGSGLRTQAKVPVALEGYCPVSLKTMNKWVKGSPASKSVFDGHTYYFANQQGKQMFDHEPAKYVPVLGGDCAVSYVKMGKRVPGNTRDAAWHGGRIFTFANAEGKKMFLADPSAYAHADLAYGGKCNVCSVNMKQTVTGKPEFAVLRKGLRYQFPSAGPRDEFLANPEKYEVSANAAQASSGGSGSRQLAGYGSSTR